MTFVTVNNGDWDETRAELTGLRKLVVIEADDNNAALPALDDGFYRRINHIRDVNPTDPIQPVLTAAFLEAMEHGDGIPDYMQLQTMWEVVEECQ